VLPLLELALVLELELVLMQHARHAGL